MHLHILNGDAMLPAFREAGIPGEVLVWREAAIDGPLAAEMGSVAAREARAVWLARRLGIDAATYRREFDERQRALAAIADRPDVEAVLWFERDLFCELHLLDLLGRSAGRPWAASVVHPPSLAVGPQRLAELFAGRHACTPQEREAAAVAWRAVVAGELAALAGHGAASPWLGELLAAMAEDLAGERPDTRGLTRFDRTAIEFVAAGRRSPVEVFRHVRAHEATRGLGLGDLQVWVRLARLVERGWLKADEPLPRADRDAPVDRPTLWAPPGRAAGALPDAPEGGGGRAGRRVETPPGEPDRAPR